jgi:ribosome-associated translation inhibitor RaiA
LSKNVITFHITSYDGTAYVAQKLYQLNRHRKKLIHELFFTVSMENNKDTELLEFVVRIPIYSLSSFTTRWNYKE